MRKYAKRGELPCCGRENKNRARRDRACRRYSYCYDIYCLFHIAMEILRFRVCRCASVRNELCGICPQRIFPIDGSRIHQLCYNRACRTSDEAWRQRSKNRSKNGVRHSLSDDACADKHRRRKNDNVYQRIRSDAETCLCLLAHLRSRSSVFACYNQTVCRKYPSCNRFRACSDSYVRGTCVLEHWRHYSKIQCWTLYERFSLGNWCGCTYRLRRFRCSRACGLC